MQASYKRDLNNNYLILKATEPIDTSSYQVRVLTSNHVDGFLACMTQMVDNQVLFYYEITAKQSFANIYENQKIKREDLQLLFDCLIKEIEEMRGFLLDVDGLLLNPEYIYLDARRAEVSFCYFPETHNEITNSLQELAEYLLPKIDHTDQEAVILGYNIYRCIMEEGVSLEQLKKEIYQERVALIQPEEMTEWEPDGMEIEEPSDEWIKSLMEESEQAVHPAVSTIIIAITGVLLFVYFYFINNTEFSWHIYVMVAVALLVIAGVSAGLYLYKMKKVKNVKMKETNAKKIKTKDEEAETNRLKSINPKIFRKKSDKPKDANTKSTNYQNPTLEDEDILANDYTDIESRVEKEWLDSHIKEAGSKSVLDNGEETVILKSPELTKMPCLAGVHPAMLQPILVKKDVFILGKLEKCVDAVLPSFAASRIHAKITKDGEYYLSDLNSLNGTYLNNKILSNDEKHLLNDGDEIAFGDLVYCFKKNGLR